MTSCSSTQKREGRKETSAPGGRGALDGEEPLGFNLALELDCVLRCRSFFLFCFFLLVLWSVRWLSEEDGEE